jgi:hypothetical protein
MIDPQQELVLTGAVPKALLQEIARGNQTGVGRIEPRWIRSGVFLLAFIVGPGVLGYLRITSDLFNVGLMTGGFVAMLLDGFLMDQRPKTVKGKKLRVTALSDRSLGPRGVTVNGDGHVSTYTWDKVRDIRAFSGGIGLRTGHRGLVPIATSELPPGATLDDLKAAIAHWRSKASPA